MWIESGQSDFSNVTTPAPATDERDTEEDVVRADAQDMVLVQLTFRKPGTAGKQNPHGYTKLELRQPRSMRRTWEQCREFIISQMPGSPGMNIVFDGQLIRPRDAGRITPSETDSQLADQGEIHELSARREALIVDNARLTATLDALSAQHIKTREHYGEEEKRLQASIREQQMLLNELRKAHAAEEGKAHERAQQLLEGEVKLATLTRDQMAKFDADLRDSIANEAKKLNAVADVVDEARARASGGSMPERLLNNAYKNFRDLLDTELGKGASEAFVDWLKR